MEWIEELTGTFHFAFGFYFFFLDFIRKKGTRSERLERNLGFFHPVCYKIRKCSAHGEDRMVGLSLHQSS